MNSAYNTGKVTYILKEEFKKVPLNNTSVLEYLYDFHDPHNREEQSCSKFKVQSTGKLCNLENLHRSIMHSFPLHFTSKCDGTSTNDTLSHDDCHNESIITCQPQMDRNTNCSDQKNIQTLNKDVCFRSQLRSREVFIDDWFISKTHHFGENGLDKISSGLLCSRDMQPPTNLNVNTDHTMKIFNLTPKNICDIYVNHKGNDSSPEYNRKERSTGKIGSNLCSQSANDCDFKHNKDHYNKYISSKMPNLGNYKRKLPMNISEGRQKTAKILPHICSDLNVSRTRKDSSLMHRVRNYGRNVRRAHFKNPDNRADGFPLSVACPVDDQSSLLYHFRSFWSIKNACFKQNSVVISMTASRIQQRFTENRESSNICLITGRAICSIDSAAIHSKLLPFATIIKPRTFARNDLHYVINSYYFDREEQWRYQDSSAICNSYRDVDGNLTELLVQKDIVTPDLMLNCANNIKETEMEDKENISASVTDENYNYHHKRNGAFSSILKYSPTCNDLQKKNLLLPYSNIKTLFCCLFESSGESFLSTDKTFSAQLSNTRQPEERHFASDIVYTIPALSLHGGTKNGYSLILERNFPSTSEVGFFLENVLQCLKYSFKNLGITLEETEEDSLSCTETANSSMCNADPIYKTTIRTQASDVLNINNRGYLKQNIFDARISPNSREFNDSLNNNLRPTDHIPYSNSIPLTWKHRNNLGEIQKMSSEKGFKPFRQKSLIYTNATNISKTEVLDAPREAFHEETEKPYVLSSNDEPKPDLTTVPAVHLVKEIEKTHLFNMTIGKSSETDRMHANSSNLSHSVSEDREKNVHFHKSNPDLVKECVHEKYKMYDIPHNKTLAESSSQAGTYCLQESENITEETTSDNTSLFSSCEQQNVKFELKAQFDLVLEELSLFHKISEEQEHSCETETKNEKEYSTRPFHRAPEIINKEYIGNANTVSTNGHIFSKKVHDSKSLNLPRGQEVPCPNGSTSSTEEESLKVIEDGCTTYSWRPAFVSCEHKEGHFSAERPFSHGIGRLTPLKTRTGPLRIGLSKKARFKQLHPYLR
ncbi:RAD51-associated protein 2 [Xenopus tropicalis]|uniref:RAD51-associated protein 2 n=1 Tax=Xenopus tropicalis TaxID=8364 RepID=A0A6I8QWB7_XENTR|nr:RAD51-associated protein 2 [Xenopus tropicalis]